MGSNPTLSARPFTFEKPIVPSVADAYWALGLLERSLGKSAKAHEQLGPLVDGLRAAGVGEPDDMRFVTDEIEALIGIGRLGDANALLDWYGGLAEAAGRQFALAAWLLTDQGRKALVDHPDIALQPNLNIPVYIVAPEARRKKVIEAVNRPTFRRLDPPMAEVTRFIPFDSLRAQIEKAGPLIKHLKPDFIEEMAEKTELG